MKSEDLINEIVSMKTGDRQMAIFIEESRYTAEIGNPSQHVMLGEVRGEFFAQGGSLEEALVNLRTMLQLEIKHL